MTLLPRLVTGYLCAVLLLWPAAGWSADPEPEPAAVSMPDTWHATTFVTGGMGLRMINYWSKGDWMRAETLISGHPIVTIVRDQEYVSFDRLTGKGIRILRSPTAIKQDGNRTRPFGNDLEELVAQGAVKVEDSVRSGRDVEIWRITDTSGRRKLWVTREEPQLPMRVENFVRSGADTITTDYSNWVRGLEIPDSFFKPSSDLQLEQFEYAQFLESSGERPIGPVLYPDLLHGTAEP